MHDCRRREQQQDPEPQRKKPIMAHEYPSYLNMLQTPPPDLSCDRPGTARATLASPESHAPAHVGGGLCAIYPRPVLFRPYISSVTIPEWPLLRQIAPRDLTAFDGPASLSCTQ